MLHGDFSDGRGVAGACRAGMSPQASVEKDSNGWKRQEGMIRDATISFVKSGRGKAQCPSNPQYPHGIAIELSTAGPACKFEVPYPAPECGHWLIRCKTCHLYFALTAAGRVDDPVSLTVPCDYPELVQ